MDPTSTLDRLARLRAECEAVGRELVGAGHSLSPDESFELAGAAARLSGAADGLAMTFAAYGARVEHTLHEPVWRERVHAVGFVDEMAPAEVSAATGLTEGLAGRKVALGAALSSRFPRLRDLVLAGDVPAASAHKVVDACTGLDEDACAAVDAALAGRLSTMDPARVARAAREAATRVAADQVAAQQERARRGRTVQVRPAEDGLTEWWALLPTDASTAMAAAVDQLAGTYQSEDPDLSMSEARADALADLVLENVTVRAAVTLGIPVLTDSSAHDPDAADGAECAPGWERVRIERDPDDTVVDAVTGEVTRIGDLTPASREDLSWVDVPTTDHVVRDARFTEEVVVNGGLSVSGCDLPGVGFVPAGVVAGMLKALPLDVTRALLDADTGTLASTTSHAYVPPKAIREFVTTRDGTCRMWGCTRRAEHLDLDHTRPWPHGPTSPANLAGLCRRHHRLKQQGRWRYRLDPDGTVTWTGPTGQTRVTEPQHRIDPLPTSARPEATTMRALIPSGAPPF